MAQLPLGQDGELELLRKICANTAAGGGGGGGGGAVSSVNGQTGDVTLTSDSLGAAKLAGGNTFTGIQSSSGAQVVPTTAISLLAVDITKRLSTKSVALDTGPFTFSGSIVAGQRFGMRITNTDSVPHTITIPQVFDVGSQSLVTTFVVAPGGTETPDFEYDGTRYLAYNLPGKIKETITLACSDLATALATGTAVAYFYPPWACKILAVRAYLQTVSSSGLPTVDINEAGTSILSTKLSIDASELTSLTAATPAVISDPDFAANALLTVDIDVAGTGAKGLQVQIDVLHS